MQYTCIVPFDCIQNNSSMRIRRAPRIEHTRSESHSFPSWFVMLRSIFLVSLFHVLRGKKCSLSNAKLVFGIVEKESFKAFSFMPEKNAFITHDNAVFLQISVCLHVCRPLFHSFENERKFLEIMSPTVFLFSRK